MKQSRLSGYEGNLNPYQPPTAPLSPEGILPSRRSRLGILLAIPCLLLGLLGLACFFVIAIALIMVMIDVPVMTSDPDDVFFLLIFLGGIVLTGISSLLFLHASWSCFRCRWRRASIGFILGLGLSVVFFYMITII